MKVLWFSHFVPYPPRGGNRQRSFNLIKEVSRNHRVHLLAFNLDSETSSDLKAHKAALLGYCDEVTIWELPLRWKSIAWWMKLAVSPLYSLPFSCISFWSAELSSKLKSKVNSDRFNLIHFDSLDLAIYLSSAEDGATVLNHHNCESAMTLRRSVVERNPIKQLILAQQAKKLQQMESAVCPRFDINTIVSIADANQLKQHASESTVAVVENGTDTDYFVPMPHLEEPGTLVFTGSLDWYPNEAGLRIFIDQVWPKIKAAAPETKFFVAGKNPSASLSRILNQHEGVTLAANPEDIRPWMARGAVFVCPIYDGGGTRLKLLDAMAMGKAIVSTPIGCEGLSAEAGTHLLVADTPESMANDILALLKDEALRREIGLAANELVLNKYSWPRLGKQLLDAYDTANAKASQRCKRLGNAQYGMATGKN